MKQISILAMLLTLAACALLPEGRDQGEKIYVVQRERESLKVKSSNEEKTIEDLGNLNHATMKFKWGAGFVLARNGYLSKIDIQKDQLIKKVKIGSSGIGITFTEDHIIVVNYAPHSVVVLDKNLEVVKTVLTESRNVGVKVFKNYLVFSLMDKNEIWVLDIAKDYALVKKFENVGLLPFDALINDGKYLVGFFNEPSIGFLDLNDFSYQKIELEKSEGSVVYKVPHFGYWGIVKNIAFVPIAARKSILMIDLVTKNKLGEIPLPGEPVFAAVSPDKKILVVNFSGAMENSISIIDTENKKLLSSLEVAKRVMHLRFSGNGKNLYVTSYFENQMHTFNVADWTKLNSLDVATPSGVFLNTIAE